MFGWCRPVWARKEFVAGAALAATAAFAGPARGGLDQPVDGARYPTAGLLEHREYRFQARVSPGSALLLGARLGMAGRVQLGVFYGSQHLLESEEVSVNPHVGFEVRARVWEESSRPGFALGFSSQGWGEYDRDLERYERKSPGFYAVASKNWHSFLGDLSLSAGLGYSLETDAGDGAPDVFAAADWTIADRVSVLCDVDGAFNDDRRDGIYGEGGAYVDVGLRVVLGSRLSVMLVFSDLGGAQAGVDHPGRELEIVYSERF